MLRAAGLALAVTTLLAGPMLSGPVLAQDAPAEPDSADGTGESILQDGEALPDVPSTPEALAPESSTDSRAASAVASAPAAILRGLDRVTGETQDLPLRVGATADLFRLQVSLSDCRYPVNDPASNAYAHLTIRERGEVVFNGWMVAASPALSAMDNARYDVWALTCAR
ncbi:DUF2155 domain-containing protein [Frigidibacter sp. MR17.14]|uniref:DUF2155 domain-containing protein n=1 Tax=Frigidibacter sp. MR17.14 TaxID=3126509 RepID=UPI003012AD10